MSPLQSPHLPIQRRHFPLSECLQRSKVALGLFRILVQKEIGYKSEKPGYDGLIDEAQNYMVVQVGDSQQG